MLFAGLRNAPACPGETLERALHHAPLNVEHALLATKEELPAAVIAFWQRVGQDQ